jgi:hypothetical protein
MGAIEGNFLSSEYSDAYRQVQIGIFTACAYFEKPDPHSFMQYLLHKENI